jgi:hypothetical protein
VHLTQKTGAANGDIFDDASPLPPRISPLQLAVDDAGTVFVLASERNGSDSPAPVATAKASGIPGAPPPPLPPPPVRTAPPSPPVTTAPPLPTSRPSDAPTRYVVGTSPGAGKPFSWVNLPWPGNHIQNEVVMCSRGATGVWLVHAPTSRGDVSASLTIAQLEGTSTQLTQSVPVRALTPIGCARGRNGGLWVVLRGTDTAPSQVVWLGNDDMNARIDLPKPVMSQGDVRAVDQVDAIAVDAAGRLWVDIRHSVVDRKSRKHSSSRQILVVREQSVSGVSGEAVKDGSSRAPAPTALPRGVGTSFPAIRMLPNYGTAPR